MLVFPSQTLTQEQHIAFAEVIGPMEPSINTYQDEVKKDRIDNRISDVSNLDQNHQVELAKRLGRLKGLPDQHAVEFFEEVRFKGLVIDCDIS